jgi:uncharacterized protein
MNAFCRYRFCVMSFLTGLLLVVLTTISEAQQTQASISLLAKPVKNVIKLRWAVSDAATWKLSNQYGFSIERATVMRNGQFLDVVEKKILAESLRPASLAQWQSAKTNSYAGIVAQALYGKTFEASMDSRKSPAEVLNIARESEQRFSFALFACDQSFEVATLAALGYTDSTALQNESYYYKVYTHVPREVLSIDTAKHFVSLKQAWQLPAVPWLTVEFQEQTALLQWNTSMVRNMYTSYQVERSEDGKFFSSVNKYPVAAVGKQDSTRQGDWMVYQDSVSSTTKIYYYRVIGVDAFGDSGTPSLPVKGKMQPILTAAPFIKSAKEIAPGKVEIKWDFPLHDELLLSGFSIQQSDKANGKYDTLQSGIAFNQRSMVLDFSGKEKRNRKSNRKNNTLLSSNYFTVTARVKNGSKSTSFPVLLQVPDSIPPRAPDGLKVAIDSAGFAKLTWKENTETDLLGYRIYRGNTKKEESVLLTPQGVANSTYEDTVQVNTLSQRVYYTVVAIDKHYNASIPSVTVEVKRPNRLPPSPPTFGQCYLNKTGAIITWYNSSSDGVVKHTLYRKAVDTDSWLQIKEFTVANLRDSIVGNRVDAGKTYQYKVTAWHENGLSASTAEPYTMTISQKSLTNKIEKLNAVANRAGKQIELTWQRNEKNIKSYWIYRHEENKRPALLKVVEGGTSVYADKNVKINTTYYYTLKGMVLGGGQTVVTEPVKVVY